MPDSLREQTFQLTHEGHPGNAETTSSKSLVAENRPTNRRVSGKVPWLYVNEPLQRTTLPPAP